MAINTTSTSSSPSSQGSQNTLNNRPTEASISYFPSPPETPEDSPRVSISDARPDGAPKLIKRTDTGANPLPPFARDFPQPVQDIDVAKQLALKPLNRSLHDSLKRFGTQDRVQKVEDAEARARKLEAAKKELLDLNSNRTW